MSGFRKMSKVDVSLLKMSVPTNLMLVLVLN